MKSLFLILVTLFTIEIFANDYISIPAETSLKSGVEKAKEAKKDLIVFTYTDYCPWCDRMKAHTLEDFNVVDYVVDNFVFSKVNRDTGDLPKKMVSQYIPTTYILDPNTLEIKKRIVGYKSPEEFLYELEKYKQ